MERSQINKEDTWDLTKIFKNNAEYDKVYQEVLAKIDEIKAMKSHILDDENTLYKYLKTNDELSIFLGKIYTLIYIITKMPMPLKAKNIRRKLKAYLLKLRKNWHLLKMSY